MTIDALGGILLIPAIAAGLLAALPGYRVEAWLNVLAALLTFATAVSLFVVEPVSGPYPVSYTHLTLPRMKYFHAASSASCVR